MTSIPRISRGAAVLSASLLLAACQQGADQATADAAEGDGAGVPETASGRISYGAGFAMADNMRQQLGEDFDGNSFSMGVADAVAERERQVDDADLASARDEIVARREAAQESAAQENATAAANFLAENADREGVQVTESGLQYKVLEEGDGASPSATDTVVVHYTGTLLDGTVFDSSVERGEPASFGVDQVIPGWTEALQLMEVGDSFQIWLPPELAYGPRPPSPAIPPNALLVFEVELLEVQAAEVREETGMSEGEG